MSEPNDEEVLVKDRLWLCLFATLFVVALLLASSHYVMAADSKLRPIAVDEEGSPEPLASEEQAQSRRVRPYPMVAPTIPHSTEGFVINKDVNQCLMCHNAQSAPMMKAPTIGESHYQNRDGQYLLEVSQRRYFCSQCHVPQVTRQNPVANDFGQ